MDAMLASSSFKIYAAVCALLGLKLVLLALATGAARGRGKRWVNPEDTKMMGGEVGDTAWTSRLQRAHGNGIDNELLFMFLGLLYLLMGSPTEGMQAYGYTFLIARVLHSLTYLFALQPFRSLSWVVGTLCLVGMAVQILLVAFGG